MSVIRLTTPLSKEDAVKLKAGDQVLISGYPLAQNMPQRSRATVWSQNIPMEMSYFLTTRTLRDLATSLF